MKPRHLAPLVGLFITLALGVRTQAAAASPAAIKLTGLKLFPDTPKGHFGEPLPAQDFLASQKRQLFILYFDKTGAGQKVGVNVIATKTTLGLEKPVKSFGVAAIDAEGRLPMEIKYPQSWPVGSYRIEVTQGNTQVGQASYRVRAAESKKTPVKAESFKVFRDKAGGAVEEVQAPKASDRHLYFAAQTRGARTDGAKVTWTCTAVDTSAGKNKKVGSFDIEAWPLDDTVLTFDIELPRDWPTGKYRLEVWVDGESIGTGGFEIKP